jgi:hypothetical protein
VRKGVRGKGRLKVKSKKLKDEENKGERTI